MSGITVVINGKPCAAEIGETLLSVASRNDIYIPTLCHSDALPGQGCCRICTVEIDEGQGLHMVSACVYKLIADATVKTEGKKTKIVRDTMLALLRARAPGSDAIRAMNTYYEVPEKPNYIIKNDDKCILCGLCVRACTTLGNSAISTVGRGVEKKIATWYEEPSVSCVGCGSCAAVCPTGAIELRENEGIRTIWEKDFVLVRCQRCSKAFATEEELAFSRTRTGAETEIVLCEECRRLDLSEKIEQLLSDDVDGSKGA